MSKNCHCKFCGRPTDCSGDVCALHEGYREFNLCSDEEHCEVDELIREVKKDVFQFKKPDGTFYLKWIPS